MASKVLSVDIVDFELTKLIESICSDCVVPRFIQMSFEEAYLEVNPGSTVQEFNSVSFEPGAAFRLDGFDLFGLLSGSADFIVVGSSLTNPSKLVLHLTFNQTNLFGIVAIASAGKPSSFTVSPLFWHFELCSRCVVGSAVTPPNTLLHADVRDG